MEVRGHPVLSARGIRHGPEHRACRDAVSKTDIRQRPYMGVDGNQQERFANIVSDKHRTAQKIITKTEDLSGCHDRNLHARIKLSIRPRGIRIITDIQSLMGGRPLSCIRPPFFKAPEKHSRIKPPGSDASGAEGIAIFEVLEIGRKICALHVILICCQKFPADTPEKPGGQGVGAMIKLSRIFINRLQAVHSGVI